MDDVKKGPFCSDSVKGILSFIGSAMTHLAIGYFYVFPGLAIYGASYMRFIHDLDVLPSNFTHGITILTGTMAVGMGIAYTLGLKISSQAILFISAVLFSMGSWLSQFALDSFWLFILFQCLFIGISKGMSYTLPMKIVAEWFPKRKGLFIGTILACFSLSFLIFSPIQYLIINPENIVPKRFAEYNNETFYTDNSVLENFKHYLNIIPYIHCSLILFGAALIVEKKKGSKIVEQTKLNTITNTDNATSVNPEVESEMNSETESEVVQETENSEHVFIGDYMVSLRLILTLGNLWIYWCCFAVNAYFITNLAKSTKFGYAADLYDERSKTFISVLCAISNTLSRIIVGYLTDIIRIDCILKCLYSLILLSMTSLLMFGAESVIVFGFSLVVQFFCLGGFLATTSPYLINTIGTNNLQLGNIFLQIGQTLFSVLGSYINHFFDVVLQKPHYNNVFVMILVSLAFIAVICFGDRMNKPILVKEKAARKHEMILKQKKTNKCREASK